MDTEKNKTIEHVPHTRVSFDGGFWAELEERNRQSSIPAVLGQLQNTGHIDAFKLEWKPGDPKIPHVFWDSDLAKWMEGAAYSLATDPDPELEKQMDTIIDMMEKAQQPDGYLNTHYIVVEPEKRWTNLRDTHELYCAGHLIEAAVAYDQATGKHKFLDVMRRYTDHIATVFGPEAGQKRGYDGHQEIELALMKLYRHTGDERYFKLGQFFIEERGQQPYFFDAEARERGDNPEDAWFRTYEYMQAHQPVREQEKAVGHSVRAMYLYSAMADLALETGDKTLLAALKTLWRDVVGRRMYVTGGIGSSRFNEGWSWDYDLPNDAAYTETCAAIGMILWAHRMLLLDLDGEYADIMERALYNGFLSSTDHQGDHFFYVNPLEVERTGEAEKQRWHMFTGHRKEWYGCACCPPNIVRLMASLTGYFYSQGEGEIIAHHFGRSTAQLEAGGQAVTVRQETNYPWDGTVTFTFAMERPAAFAFRVRVPGWCRSASLAVNGQAVEAPVERGYARVEREWQPGDTLTLSLPMPVERVRANPRINANLGKVALLRGPLVFCLESIDNGENLGALCLPEDAQLEANFDADLLDGMAVIEGPALREPVQEGVLYTTAKPERQETRIRAIPYYAWDNRGEGEMRVWIREC